MVNGGSFEALSSGGMKTLINTAYRLALFRTGLEADLLLPGLLIIDSPRKNLGRQEDDQEAGRRIYLEMERLSEDAGGNLQLIVADNDRPPAFDTGTSIELS